MDITLFMASITSLCLTMLLAVMVWIMTGGIPVRLIMSPVVAQVAVSSMPAKPRFETKIMRIYERDLARFTAEYAMKRGYGVVGIVYGSQKGTIDVKMSKVVRWC